MRYDKTKLSVITVIKMGHYSWECRSNVGEKVNLVDDKKDKD